MIWKAILLCVVVFLCVLCYDLLILFFGREGDGYYYVCLRTVLSAWSNKENSGLQIHTVTEAPIPERFKPSQSIEQDGVREEIIQLIRQISKLPYTTVFVEKHNDSLRSGLCLMSVHAKEILRMMASR